MPEVLMNKKEVAFRLGVSVRTVEQMMSDRRISFVKVGKSVRFDWQQVQTDLTKQTVKARRVA